MLVLKHILALPTWSKFLYHVKTQQEINQTSLNIIQHLRKYQFAKNNPKCNFFQIAFTVPKSMRAIFSNGVLKTDPLILHLSALQNINTPGERSFTISFTETIKQSTCLDAAKEEKLRERQSPDHPGLDFNSPLDVSIVS